MSRQLTTTLVALLGGALLGFACGGSGLKLEIGDGGAGDGASAGSGGTNAGGGFFVGMGGNKGSAATAGSDGGPSGGSTPGGGTAGVSGGTAGAGGGTAGAGGSTVTPGPVGAASAGCPVSPSQCTDGKDNDGDGKLDAADPECSGPCDNDEGSFATGIPGDNKDDLSSCKQDCFFDGNSGADEGCQFDLRCDPARTNAKQCKTGTQPGGVRCEQQLQQSDQCRKTCGRLTPNGCDCFGCCQIPGAGFAVRLTPTCTAASLNDPAKCERCTQVVSCLNTCEKCEVCYGKPSPDPSCATPPPGTVVGTGGSGGGGSMGTGGSAGTGGSTGAGGSTGTGGTGGSTTPGPCATGVVYCGTNGAACPTGQYCLTGCCVRLIE